MADPALAPQSALLEQAEFPWPTSEERRFLGLILDYDPVPAMGRLACQVLALHGAADSLVPVTRSVEAFERELGRRGLLTTMVLPGVDHRMRGGHPPRLAPGYPAMIGDWILGLTARDSAR